MFRASSDDLDTALKCKKITKRIHSREKIKDVLKNKAAQSTKI